MKYIIYIIIKLVLENKSNNNKYYLYCGEKFNEIYEQIKNEITEVLSTFTIMKYFKNQINSTVDFIFNEYNKKKLYKIL